MNFSVRSSRVTGPKMRVPMGFFCIQQHGSIAIEFDERTVAAANALRPCEPPLRCKPRLLTRPRGAASLTLTLMMSPTLA